MLEPLELVLSRLSGLVLQQILLDTSTDSGISPFPSPPNPSPSTPPSSLLPPPPPAILFLLLLLPPPPSPPPPSPLSPPTHHNHLIRTVIKTSQILSVLLTFESILGWTDRGRTDRGRRDRGQRKYIVCTLVFNVEV